MKRYILSIIMIGIFITCSSQHISDEILLDDGRKVCFDHIFKEYDNCTFNSDGNFKWVLSVISNVFPEEDIELAIDSGKPSRSYHLDISKYNLSVINGQLGIDVNPVAYDIDGQRFYKSNIIIYDGEEEVDRKQFQLKLAPDIPQIKAATFNYEYDWDYDDLGIDGGTLILKLEVGEINRLCHWRAGSVFHAFEAPEDSAFDYGCYENFLKLDDKIGELTIKGLDWGEFIKIYTVNQFGISKSLILNTTDFITDQVVLERIKSLNSNSLSNVVVHSLLSMSLRGDYIVVNGDQNRDFRIDLTDLSGISIMSEQNNRNTYIGKLERGVYIVSLISDNRLIQTLKISR